MFVLAAILADKEGKEIEVLNPLEVSLRCREVFSWGRKVLQNGDPRGTVLVEFRWFIICVLDLLWSAICT